MSIFSNVDPGIPTPEIPSIRYAITSININIAALGVNVTDRHKRSE